MRCVKAASHSPDFWAGFRDDEGVLGGNIVICGWRDDGDAQHFQFAGGAEDIAGAFVGGFSGEKADERGARIDF